MQRVLGNSDLVSLIVQALTIDDVRDFNRLKAVSKVRTSSFAECQPRRSRTRGAESQACTHTHVVELPLRR